MTDLEKSIHLYELIATRFESSDFTPHQASAYREGVAILKACSSMEEAMARLSEGENAYKFALALVKDNVLTYKRVSQDSGFPEVAAIYTEQLEKLEREAMNAYTDSGFRTKAENIKADFFNKLSGVEKIYEEYITLTCAEQEAKDPPPLKSPYIKASDYNNQHMPSAFGFLTRVNGNFDEVTKDDRVKKNFQISDSCYEKFVSTARELEKTQPPYYTKTQEFKDETDRIYNALKDKKEELKSNLKAAEANSVYGYCAIIAPKDKNEHYEFVEFPEKGAI